jgi:hypothetical protein
MESLSKETNLIVGLFLGMAIAIAIPRLTPQELGAIPVDSELQAMTCTGMQNLDPTWMGYGEISLRCN